MKLKFTSSFLFLLFTTVSFVKAQIVDLNTPWKFQTGDSLSWSKKNYNDQLWKKISVDGYWENNGYKNYDGYAWYRKSVDIPIEIRPLVKKGGLILRLGKIDDADQTYFNGTLIGETGAFPPHYQTAYSEPRIYQIPQSLINLDKPNIIAVRIYDGAGNGGIYGGPMSIEAGSGVDLIKLGLTFEDKDWIFINEPVKLKAELENKGNENFNGFIKLDMSTDERKFLVTQSQKVSLAKGAKETYTFTWSPPKPGFYRAALYPQDNIKKGLIKTFNVGYNPEQDISKPDAQSDFKEYWSKAKKELNSIDPKFNLIKIDSLCTATKDMYKVEMRSLENALIRGWYSVPKKAGRYPALLKVQGYSSNIPPAHEQEDFVIFSLNIRGHGTSKDDINPGFPGYLLYNIEDKNKYVYRGAYMDCVRAVDFICSRTEADSSKIAVEGGSQGGALSFATAALDHRIKFCAPHIPFLSDFPRYFKICGWPANEFIDYVKKDSVNHSWKQVFYTLSYIDIKNLAPWIKCPVFMAAGLQDEICPPHINFAAYNNLKTEKSWVVYPLSGHDVPPAFHEEKWRLIRKQFGMK